MRELNSIIVYEYKPRVAKVTISMDLMCCIYSIGYGEFRLHTQILNLAIL